MTRLFLRLASLAAAVVLAGCATPQIDASKFTPPKTVVIDDFPDINPVATIQPTVTNWPEMYFSGRFDGFFTYQGRSEPLPPLPSYSDQANQIATNQILSSPRPSVAQGAAMGAAGGVVGALIQASAEDTERKAAAFPAIVRKTFPGDLRTEVLAAVRQGLENKGIQVRVAGETRNLPPRLHWPGRNEKGEPLAAGVLAGSPSVEADLLVQVVPVAAYTAPGPLNTYTRKAGIAVALFEGRTRRFIGWQAFPFRASDNKFEYIRYEGLLADVENAGPALRNALLSLVPQVVDTIAGRGR